MTYRFCRVPFGLICSPFLLEATIRHHLARSGTSLAQMVSDNMYVDNVLVGTSTVDDASELYAQAKSLFRSASMNLREWSSNSKEFLSSIPSEDVSPSCAKVLGLPWDTNQDSFTLHHVDLTLPAFGVTKRVISQLVARLYDPLGFVSPITFHGKRLLQQIWELTNAWDTDLPHDIVLQCTEVLHMLQGAFSVRIPRWLGTTCSQVYELQVFCDASAHAYATAVYLKVRSSCDLHTSQTHLIFSKLRLSPTSKSRGKKRAMSIPRLELMGIVIGARALTFVRANLPITAEQAFIWMDSKCSLFWITSLKPLSVFLKNRLREIRALEDVSFRHVPSTDNPADMPTRGCSAQDLTTSDLWWHGPPWLQLPSATWPEGHPEITPDVLASIQSEERHSNVQLSSRTLGSREGRQGETTALLNVRCSPSSVFKVLVASCSSLPKLLHALIFVLKFITVVVNRTWLQQFALTHDFLGHVLLSISPAKSHPTANDIQLVTLLCVRMAQLEYYPEILEAIRSNRRDHQMVRHLGLELDSSGLIRCHGRFRDSVLAHTAKLPLLLPRKCKFTDLVVMNFHVRLLHCGVSHTLANIRNCYWIPKGRSEVSRNLHCCITCRKHEGPAFNLPSMAPLPKERTEQSFPFEATGLDILGPISVKHTGKVMKVWVCLFTCFSTRAVHLEWLMDMTTEEFIRCLRRFTSRRGHPSLLLSDNAPQLRLAGQLLEREWRNLQRSNEVARYSSNAGIQWKFTTEYSPWEGGIYEWLVNLVKRCLRKSLGRTIPSLQEFQTLLVETESVLNSRPLTYVDADGGTVLTPAKFMNIQACAIDTSHQDDSYEEYLPVVDSVTKLKKKIRRLNALNNQFWKIWKKEYLLALRERSKLHRKCKSTTDSLPFVNEVVIVSDDGPRTHWRLGKILRLNKSHDGEIRSAIVKSSSGRVINRSITHLYPLELHVNDKPDTSDDSA